MKKILPFLILFVATVVTGHAQNIASITISWSSTSTFYAEEGKTTEEETQLVTHGSNSVEWKNSDGTVRKNYQVLEVINGWSNVTVAGSAQFKISDGQNGGLLLIERVDGGIKARIAIGSEEPELIELTIISHEVL